MDIEFKKPTLIQEYFSLLLNDKISEKGNNNVSVVTNKIDNYIDKIKTYKLLMEKDRNIPNSVYLSMIKELAYIKLKDDDLLNILSLKERINYNRVLLLNTDMFARRKKTSYVTFKVASTCLLNTRHIYNTEELNSLIEDKTIVLLGEYLKTLNIEKYKSYEKYTRYDYYSLDDFKNVDGRLYIYTLQYVRNIITNERLKNELDIYINLLKEEINKVTNNEYLINNSRVVSKDISNELEEKQIMLKLK